MARRLADHCSKEGSPSGGPIVPSTWVERAAEGGSGETGVLKEVQTVVTLARIAHFLGLSLTHGFDTVAPAGGASLGPALPQLWQWYATTLAFPSTKSKLSTDRAPGDALPLLCSHLLVSEAVAAGEAASPSNLLEALALLKASQSSSAFNFTIKVARVRLLSALSAASAAFDDVFIGSRGNEAEALSTAAAAAGNKKGSGYGCNATTGLEIKQVQHESLSHYILDDLRRQNVSSR